MAKNILIVSTDDSLTLAEFSQSNLSMRFIRSYDLATKMLKSEHDFDVLIVGPIFPSHPKVGTNRSDECPHRTKKRSDEMMQTLMLVFDASLNGRIERSIILIDSSIADTVITLNTEEGTKEVSFSKYLDQLFGQTEKQEAGFHSESTSNLSAVLKQLSVEVPV